MATSNMQRHETTTPYLSKEDKIKILEELLEEFLPDTPLKMQESFCGVNRDDSTSSHFYQILGNTQRRKTQTVNLQYKLKDLESHPLYSTNWTQKANPEKQSDNRYFKSNIKCFRCKEFGHYASHCSEEATFCMYCLSMSHATEICPQRIVCFGCYGFGHIANNCRQSQGVVCQTCGRRHRGDCGFLAKGHQNIKTLIVRHGDSSQALCMVCYQHGHINCQPENSE